MVLWVFGYASLVWKAGFVYDDRVVGFIKGYRRTFHLACIDHRETPEYPARAANLDPEEGSVCWGIAYCIKDDEAARSIVAYLEVRECEYDVKAHVDFFTEESPLKPLISNVLVFLTTPDVINNKYYLGPAPLPDMARQIATATGPNGPNYVYLFRLEEALRQIGHEDEEVIELAREVRKVLHELNNNVHTSTQNIVLSGISHNNGLQDLGVNSLNIMNHGALNGITLSSLALVKSQAM